MTDGRQKRDFPSPGEPFMLNPGPAVCVSVTRSASRSLEPVYTLRYDVRPLRLGDPLVRCYSNVTQLFFRSVQ